MKKIIYKKVKLTEEQKTENKEWLDLLSNKAGLSTKKNNSGKK